MAIAVQQRRQNGFILGMARSIHFFLSVVSLVSILLLIVGFVVSMSNVMTGGAIVDSTMMKRAWAIATSSAIEANIPLMFFSAWASWRDKKYWEGWCSLLLGLALAIITGISVGIESLQQSLVGQTIESATVKMHIDMATFIYCRVALIILLVAREGYHLFVILEDVQNKESEVPESSVLPVEKRKFFLIVWWCRIWSYFFSKKEEQIAQPKITRPLSEPSTEGITLVTEHTEEGKTERTTDPELRAFTEHSKPAQRRSPISSKRARVKNKRERGNGVLLIQQELAKNPDIRNAEICRNTGLTASYVSSVRKNLEESKVAG